MARRRGPGARAIRGGRGDAGTPRRRAGRMLGLHGRAGDEARQPVVPGQRRARLAGQMHGRIDAARNAEQIGRDAGFRAARWRTRTPRTTGRAGGADHLAAVQTVMPRSRAAAAAGACPSAHRPRRQSPARLPATRTGCDRRRRCWRTATRGGPAPRRTGADSPRRAGQHHAGPVVAGESDEPLIRTGRQHHRPRPDGPVALARRVRRRAAADRRPVSTAPRLL